MAALTPTLIRARDAVCYAECMIALQSSSRPAPFLPGSDDREDEDTIEMQLTPIQMGLLTRAAEEAERDSEPPAAEKTGLPVDLPPKPPVAVAVTPPSKWSMQGKRLYLAASGGVILLVLSVTIAYQLGARVRSAPAAPADRVTEPADARMPAPPPPMLQETEGVPAAPAPVRFTNPFDTGEVFEFPPGTSNAEARDAVASLLIKRAQERQTSLHWPYDKPQPSHPDPSLAQRT